MKEWLDEFYSSDATRAALMTSFAPLFHEYANGVWAAEGGKGSPPQPFVEGLIDGYVTHHLESSRAQLQEVVAGDTPFEALATRLDEWAEKRPEKVAGNETTRTANAIALEAMRSMGATEKVWVTSGTCAFCKKMAGKRAALNEPFISAGDEVNPEGAEPMRVRSNIGHPPLHQGCQCSIEPDNVLPMPQEAALEWQNRHEAMRDSLIRGKPSPETRRLLNGLREAPLSDKQLYRGMWIRDEDWSRFQQSWAPGSEVDFSLSSFTPNRGIASDYAIGPSRNRIIVQMEPGAKALDIAQWGNVGAADEELVCAGRFRVLDVIFDQESKRTVFRIEQVRNLQP